MIYKINFTKEQQLDKQSFIYEFNKEFRSGDAMEDISLHSNVKEPYDYEGDVDFYLICNKDIKSIKDNFILEKCDKLPDNVDHYLGLYKQSVKELGM